MKLLEEFLWTALGACSVAAETLVYTSDVPPASRVGMPSISPNTARLLLAQRLGLSQFHSLEGADESTLDILNTYGGKQKQLFTDEEHARSNDRLLLVVDEVTKPEDIFDHSIRPAVTIDAHPTTSQNIDFVLDLVEQDQDNRAQEYNRCHFQIPSSSDGSILSGGLGTSHMASHSCIQWYQRLAHHASGALAKTPLSRFKDAFEAFGSEGSAHNIILHISSLKGLTPKDGDLYTAAVSDLKAFIDYFHQPKNHILSTIVIMPATSKSSKRSTTSPWGNYIKPAYPRQQQPEEPLSSSSNPSAHQPSAPEVLQTSPPPSALPHGVLPLCYSSREIAAARTNNCSGHGSIYQKGTDKDHECYACRCSKTVLTDDEGGVKTVYWGGAACQKKDVSVQFFLLAGLTIALVGAVTWGVGLLMSVGNEELPSVIGAGVAGPRAQTQK